MVDSAIPRAAPSPQGQRNAQPIAAAGRSLEQARRENLSSEDLKKTDEATSVAARIQAPADAVERKSGGESGELAGVRDDARLKENNEKTLASAASAPPVPQPKVEESRESTKIPKDSALRLPAQDSRSAKVETLKPGAPDAGPKTERDKDTITAIRSTDGDAPKHKAALEPESHSRLAAGARGRALVAGESARLDRAHSPEKTVGKKTFWLSRGVWTDSEYNSDRKLPVVTVVRDSDVYKELLEKNNKLTVFFKGFNETERAIIVFKNTVYNLIPQSDNK